MPVFCYTCLSEDRRVKPVDIHVKSTLLEWFNNSNFKIKVDRFLLCWECHAKIVKLNKFKRQVFKAQHIRLKVNKKKSARLVKLSQMCIYSKEIYDFTYVYKESEVEKEVTKTKKVALKRKKEKKCSKTKTVEKYTHQPEPDPTLANIVNIFNYLNGIKKGTSTNSEDNDKKELLKEIIDLTKDPKLALMPVVLIDKEVKQELIDAYEAVNKITTPAIDVDAEQDLRPSVIVRAIRNDVAEETNPKFSIVDLTEDQMLKTRELDRSERLYMKLTVKCESCVIGFAEETELEKHNEEKHNLLIGEFECPICATRFDKESHLARHEQTHYFSYKCRQCDFESHRRYAIEMHAVKEHDLTSSPVCAACDTVFDTQQRLNAHFEEAHKERLKCNQCAQSFDTVERLKDHATSHKEKEVDLVEVFPCDPCNFTFEGKASYRAHMQCVHKELAQHAYCEQCDLQFSTLKKFKQHLKVHSPFDQLRLERATRNSQNTFMADMKRAHRMLSHSCGLCKKGFSDEMRLRDHIEQKHPEVVTEPAEDDSISLCQQTEPEVTIIEPVKDKKCPICSEGFATRNELLSHIRIHKAEKHFKCDVCDKRFTSRALLKKHSRTHDMEEDNF